MNDDSTILPHIDETVRRDFEDAWRLGQPKPIERVLEKSAPKNERLDTLEELVHIELEFAWKEHAPVRYAELAGELWRPHVEDYLKRFPELKQPAIVMRLIEQEYRVRHRNGDTPTPDEFQQRFSTVVSSDDLHARLNKISEPGERRPELPGYEITGVLGRGGMGVVYKARHKQLNRIVAVKMLLSGSMASEDEQERFRSEAEVVAQLRHPNIVQIYDVGEHEGTPFFSLEYVDGGTLAKRIGHNPQAADLAASMLQTLARAVHEAHLLGIIHRDLKPANVLIDRDGTLKIGDFGLAKNLRNDGHTNTGAVMGTPSYMSPEQAAAHHKDISPATDVYALGAMLYHILTGSPPFRGETPWDVVQQLLYSEPVSPRQLQPKVPRDLETICLKCLQKEPAKRYGSAAALAEDVERFLDGKPIVARPIGVLERATKWTKRRPAIAGLIVVSTLAMLTITIGSLFYSAELREYNTKLKGERTRANTARDLADVHAETAKQQTQLALSTLRSVVFDIQRELDGKMGMQALQQRLLQRAQDGLDRVARSAETAASADYTMATALAEIAEIYEIVGRTKDAEQFSTRAVEMFDTLLQDSPNDEKVQSSLAVALRTQGDILVQRGDLKGAKDSLERSLSIRRDYVESLGASASLGDRHLLVASRIALAQVLNSRGDTTAAMEEYDDCIEQLQKLKLSETDPSYVPILRDLASVYSQRGELRLARTNPMAGLEDLLQSQQIRESLVNSAAEQNRLEFQVSLVYSYKELGQAYLAFGEVKASIAAWRRCLEITRRWIDADPRNTTAQQALAFALTGIGEGLLESGDLTGASVHFEEADGIRKLLYDRDSDDASSASYRSIAYGHLASIRLLVGDSAGAEKAAESGRQILEGLSSRDITNQVTQRDLLICRSNLASVYLARGRHEEALKLATENAEKIKVYRHTRPNDLHLLSIGVGVHEVLGDIYRSQKEYDAAFAAYHECEGLSAAMVRLEPKNKATLNAVEVTHDRLGDVFLEKRDFLQAETHYRKSLAVSKQRSELDRTNATAQRYIALSHEKLARLYLAAKQNEKADSEYELYSAIMTELATQYPDNAVFLHEAAIGHNLHGDLKRRMDDTAAAKELYEASLEVSKRYLAAYPTHAFAMTDMAIALEELSDLQSNATERRHLLTEATNYRRAVAKQANAQVADRRALGLNLVQLGQATLQDGAPQDALTLLDEGLQIRQQNAEQFPSATTHSELGFVHMRIGEARQALGETDKARAAFGLSLAAFQQSLDVTTGSPKTAQRQLAAAAYFLAELEFGAENFEVAAKLYEQATKLAQAAEIEDWIKQFTAKHQIAAAAPAVMLDLNAIDDAPAEVVLDLLKLRGLSLVKAGDAPAAASTAAKLAKMRPTDPIALHAAARIAAYCQQLTIGKPELKEQADKYAALTMTLLERMRDNGYFKVVGKARIDNIESDPAFKGLRDDDAYKAYIEAVGQASSLP